VAVSRLSFIFKYLRRSSRPVAVALAVAFAASTGTQAHADTTPNPPPPRPLHDAASGSGALLGNYLAGRHAYATRDMWAAADYLSRALVDDPDNQTLLSRTVSLLVAVGRVDDALYLAQRLIESDPESRVAHILLALSAARAGDLYGSSSALLGITPRRSSPDGPSGDRDRKSVV